MFSKQSIMQMASKFLGNDKLQALSSAFDMANQITDITNDPGEALRKAGVTREDLQKAKNLVNNPMASLFLGGNKQNIIAGLDRAESFLDNKVNSFAEQPPADELEQMQANLARLK